MNSPWKSARLVYRAWETEDEPFISLIQQDAQSWLNASFSMAVPQGKSDATEMRESLRDESLLAVAICLAAPATPATGIPADPATSRPLPIGSIHLSAAKPRHAHHRHSMIGINIVDAYQRQGYGSEAIKWILQWGFRFGNLHRIELGAFEFNAGAIQLYERLGFVRESCKREHVWCDGRYWDLIELGMLEYEWRERYGDGKDAAIGASALAS